MIYTDHAATTFLCDEAYEAMLPFLKDSYGNPSSLHSMGETAKNALESARSAIADILDCSPEEVIFTSGGSEADNQAMLILDEYRKETGRDLLLISGGEHHAVELAARALCDGGMEVQTVPLCRDGTPSLEVIEELCHSAGDRLCGGSFMLANNETGSIFDICQIADIIHAKGGILHTDAVQAVGHIPVSARSLGADLISLSAHKFHGPKGTGALICRRSLPVPSLIRGGGQESGRRAGTENVPSVVGMAAALSASVKNMRSDALYVEGLREMLWDGLSSLCGAAKNGGGLPGILSVSFDGCDGEALVRSLDLYGIAASSGAACNSVELRASHVLLSMGLTMEQASSTVRFSLDASNTAREIGEIVSVMKELVI